MSGGQECYKCGGMGHIARNCTQGGGGFGGGHLLFLRWLWTHVQGLHPRPEVLQLRRGRPSESRLSIRIFFRACLLSMQKARPYPIHVPGIIPLPSTLVARLGDRDTSLQDSHRQFESLCSDSIT
ncbi:hypothetical protein EV356DRAFT_35822 [Viridothelium virens]|uniref:CCHC-type domain-containing protein n=1 Tax=Viridothelium virens TaxID=1048519 RepID=A0A6A6GTP5_VIRVR|nr:hypothetical protein EV356DRAFT_35822 [Viridothelium virens]